jgi:hypothetical protein
MSEIWVKYHQKKSKNLSKKADSSLSFRQPMKANTSLSATSVKAQVEKVETILRCLFLKKFKFPTFQKIIVDSKNHDYSMNN